MSFNDCPVLLLSPSFLLDVGIQMIMPSFSALLTDATWQMFGNICPIFSAMLHNEAHDKLVLFLGLNDDRCTQGPLISLGLSTFCQRCRHWTSVRSWK